MEGRATPANRGTAFAAIQTVMIALATSGPGHLPRTGLSICIPVYNERDAIAETLKRCLALKADLKRVGVDELEVIAVDDGSKDGSAEVIAELIAKTFE